MARYVNVDKLMSVLGINQFSHEVRDCLERHPWLVENIREVMASAWIPVSERLPDDESDVLCTARFTYFDAVGACEFIGGKFYAKTEDWDVEDVTEFVTAWMPMPNEYKGGQ